MGAEPSVIYEIDLPPGLDTGAKAYNPMFPTQCVEMEPWVVDGIHAEHGADAESIILSELRKAYAEKYLR